MFFMLEHLQSSHLVPRLFTVLMIHYVYTSSCEIRCSTGGRLAFTRMLWFRLVVVVLYTQKLNSKGSSQQNSLSMSKTSYYAGCTLIHGSSLLCYSQSISSHYSTTLQEASGKYGRDESWIPGDLALRLPSHIKGRGIGGRDCRDFRLRPHITLGIQTGPGLLCDYSTHDVMIHAKKVAVVHN